MQPKLHVQVQKNFDDLEWPLEATGSDENVSITVQYLAKFLSWRAKLHFKIEHKEIFIPESPWHGQSGIQGIVILQEFKKIHIKVNVGFVIRSGYCATSCFNYNCQTKSISFTKMIYFLSRFLTSPAG